MTHDAMPSSTSFSSGLDLQGVLAPPAEALRRLDEDIAAAGGLTPDPERERAAGFTMFDSPASQDNSVTVLLSSERIALAPSQALMRIHSGDGREYLGVVVAGPFAEPDGFRADSTVLVTVVTRGGIFVPPFHGRVQVEILGEDRNGTLVPPRYRPLPNSPAHVLDDAEAAQVLRCQGDLALGVVIGRESVEVGIPSTRKDVLPRHTAILGTTGGGKSTTVARLIQQAQAAGMAVVVLDVEGEYTFLHEPTSDPSMRSALTARGLAPAGVPNTRLYQLIGRETANPEHPRRETFSLQFARPSPYAVMEILGLTDAQRDRFMQAYDIARLLLRELGIFPQKGKPEQERFAMEIDELDRGYPRLTLSFLLDVVQACHRAADKRLDEIEPFTDALKGAVDELKRRVAAAGISGNTTSWRALLAKLFMLNRLQIFDRRGQGAEPLHFDRLLEAGSVSIIDLSDTGSPVVNNLVIADMLAGVQEAQNAAYERFEQAQRGGPDAPAPVPTLIIIEEAHEFLSAEHVDKMPVLFEQVARIARRGRKRWLGLVFVTQLPQHLPRQLFGLVNSYVLHKISDPQVVSVLQRTVSGIDEALWRRLPGLAPGQAIVSLPHMTRPLLVAVDPAPSRLRLVD